MGTWAARWRVALRIAWRDARRNKGRTALVVTMIALPLLAGTAMITAVRSAMPDPVSRLGPSAQALVEESGCAPLVQTPDLTGTGCANEGDAVPIGVDALTAAVGGAPVAELHAASVDLVTDGAVLMGWGLTEVDDPLVLPAIADVVDGRLPLVPGEVAIPADVAGRLSLRSGDTMRLARGDTEQSVTVVGTVTGSGPAAIAAIGGTVPEQWRTPGSTWVVLGDAGVTWDQVLAMNERGWTVLSRAVLLDPPPVEDIPYGMVSATETAAQDVALIGAVLAMGLLEVALLVGPAFSIGARRDSRKLALMAAAGAPPQDLRRTVLATGVVAGLVAAVVGIGLGVLLAALGVWILRRTGVLQVPGLVLPTWELVPMVVIALVVGLGAAWFPARSASRADVVTALAGRRADKAGHRGVPRLGVAVLVLGAVGMLAAAIFQEPVGLVVGVGVLEIGVVLVSGGAIALAALLAPRAGLATRFALRDAARHRGRSAPAVAAISVAVAAAVAGTVFASGQSAATAASWVRVAEPPAVLLSLDPDGGELTSDVVAQREQTVRGALDLAIDALSGEAGTIAYGAALREPSTEGGTDAMFPLLSTQSDPDQLCPHSDPAQEIDDPRCDVGAPQISSGASWYTSALVDDGTLVEAAGLPGWEEASATLQAGGVLVASSADLWPDGTVRLINDSDAGTPGEVDLQTVGYATGWRGHTWSLVLSPQAAAELGLIPVATGALITAATWPDQTTVDGVNAELREQGRTSLWLIVDRPRADRIPIAWALAGLASLVALAAVGLAVGLAAADARPDLATMTAVGAPPRIRRRIAAAQAGLLALTGSVLGLLAGTVIGLVLGLWSREQSGYRELWPLAVPWQVPLIAFAVPVVAVAVTWLFTRSRLPMVRRLAE